LRKPLEYFRILIWPAYLFGVHPGCIAATSAFPGRPL